MKAQEKYITGVDIVVDATGTYGNHNNVGMSGLPAVGERKLAGEDRLWYTIPDIVKNTEQFSSGDRARPR